MKNSHFVEYFLLSEIFRNKYIYLNPAILKPFKNPLVPESPPYRKRSAVIILFIVSLFNFAHNVSIYAMRIYLLLFFPQKTIVNQCHLYSRRITNINTFVLNQLPLKKKYCLGIEDCCGYLDFVLILDVRLDSSRTIKSR